MAVNEVTQTVWIGTTTGLYKVTNVPPGVLIPPPPVDAQQNNVTFFEVNDIAISHIAILFESGKI